MTTFVIMRIERGHAHDPIQKVDVVDAVDLGHAWDYHQENYLHDERDGTVILIFGGGCFGSPVWSARTIHSERRVSYGPAITC